jgi:hypothetical protein
MQLVLRGFGPGEGVGPYVYEPCIMRMLLSREAESFVEVERLGRQGFLVARVRLYWS